jgi:hypothetical protein
LSRDDKKKVINIAAKGMGYHINHLYAILTYKCNLKCPHCELRTYNDNYNRENFIQALKQVQCDAITLFGGEPTLYYDRFVDAVNTGKITSVSTNLLSINDDVLDLIIKHNISLSTSWNPKRFTDNQYDRWLSNVRYISDTIKPLLLVTLTDDLISYDKQSFYALVAEWRKSGVCEILFEQLYDEAKTQAYYDNVDRWLVDIHSHWCEEYPQSVILNQLDSWVFNCSKTYTLNPSGSINKGCPQYKTPSICHSCLTCEFASSCQPCMLQTCCTFPKKLYKYHNEKISV